MRPRRFRPLIVWFFLFICMALTTAVPMQLVQAATYTVTNLNNSGAGSLRQAILDANASPSDDTITFGVSGTVNLTGGQLTVENNGALTIDGGGVITIARTGAAMFRIFQVRSGATLTLNGVTITGGNLSSVSGTNGSGGAIFNDGTLVINSSAIVGNTTGSSGAYGGGISNRGTLTLTSSTVSGNSSSGTGGGVSNYGGTMTLINSTISGNSSGFYGGGLYNSGIMTVINSTVNANSAIFNGSGIYTESSSTTTLNNSIIANSPAGTECARAVSATVTAYNTLIMDGSGATCINGAGSANNTSGDPHLGAPTGSPAYYPLTAASTLAIDTGDNARYASAIGVDQAGNARIFNTTIDLGAVEYDSLLPTMLVSLTLATLTVAEGANADFIITRTGSTAADLIVNLTIAPGTATELTDYSLTVSSVPLSPQTGSTSVTIPAGQASISLNFAALDDISAEANNTLIVSIAGGIGYVAGMQSSGMATIPANDLVVTSGDDSGDGTLRQAVTNANTFLTSDTITFSGVTTVTLTTGQLPTVLSSVGSLTIRGAGVTVTRSSGTAFRLLETSVQSKVVIEGMTLTNGTSSTGGGAIYNTGYLTVIGCTFRNNTSTGTSGGGAIYTSSLTYIIDSVFTLNEAIGGSGGAINATGIQLNVVGSRFSSNRASVNGGTIASANALSFWDSSIIYGLAQGHGGGVYIGGSAGIVNSTIGVSIAWINGGGIYVADGSSTFIQNSTLNINNAGGSGSNLFVAGSTTQLDNSILASTVATQCSLGGGTLVARNSVIQTSALCANGAESVNNDTGDPRLGSLTGGGSGSSYYPLTAMSVNAIDTGDNSLITVGLVTDAAGNARVHNGIVDRGAHEYNSALTPVVSITPPSVIVSEGASGTFTLTRTGSTAASLVVNLTVTPYSADMTLDDYTLTAGGTPLSPQTGSTTVTIPAGQTSVGLVFNAVDDIPAESHNSLSVRLAAASGYVLDAVNYSGTGEIYLNDFVVTVNTDGGEGSLRQAITNANVLASNDTITFATAGPIGITGTELWLSNYGTLTINGGGVTVQRTAGSGRLFNILATTTFNQLTIIGGSNPGGNGGAISSNATGLTFNDSMVTGGSAVSGGGIYIGAGALELNNTILSNGTATTSGGNLYVSSNASDTVRINGSLITGGTAPNGAGIYTLGTVSVADSRILGNNANGTNGGIYGTSGSSVGISNSCIVNNGDNAVFRESGGTINATGNWWGSAWGPWIPLAPLGTGSYVSTGDSISGTGEAASLVNVGIVTIPQDYGTDGSIAPVGNWLATPPAGCPVCSEVSGIGHGRFCS